MLLLVLLFSLSSTSHASQEVIVKSDQITIYESPDDSSDGLALAKKGNTLKASSVSRSGWFKIELPTRIYGKKYGWIKKTDVDPVKILYPDEKKSP